MNDDEFDTLLGALLDAELTPDEAAALAIAVTADPQRRRALRAHLILWELWSQDRAPERSAAAFVAALQTRERAEQQAERFTAEVRRRIQGDECQRSKPAAEGERRPAVRARRGRRVLAATSDVWRSLRQHRRACALVSTAAVVLGGVLWLLPHPARATVTIHGEAICTACTLHETRAHLPAIRAHDGDHTVIYYVDSGRRAIVQLGDYCVAPFGVVATGAAGGREGHRTLAVSQAERTARERPAAPSDGPILFPF